MRTTVSSSAGNVVRFPGARGRTGSLPDQKSLMEAVFAAGSLPVSPQDRATKITAAGLQLFGFVVVEEVQPDGSVRRIKPSEAVHASLTHPWRVSRSPVAQTSLSSR